MRKIVVLDADTLGSDVSLNGFKDLGELLCYSETTKDQVVDRIKDATVVVTNKVVLDREVLSQLNQLELICITATGTNNVDLAYAASKGIEIKNVKGYSTDSVAQHTFACVLNLMHELAYYHDFVRTGNYGKQSLFTHIAKPYSELKGKTWGIVGLGEIGSRVAEIATVFGAKVCYFSTSGKNNNSTYTRVSWEELLKTSDIISIHAPLNDQTLDLFDSAAFALMKPTSLIANMGRGGIVNESALVDAVLNKKIKGVALDVFEHEPFDAQATLNAILQLPQVLCTPHIAWAGKEARERLIEATLENIRSFYSK